MRKCHEHSPGPEIKRFERAWPPAAGLGGRPWAVGARSQAEASAAVCTCQQRHRQLRPIARRAGRPSSPLMMRVASRDAVVAIEEVKYCMCQPGMPSRELAVCQLEIA